MKVLGLVLFRTESLVDHFQDWVQHLTCTRHYFFVCLLCPVLIVGCMQDNARYINSPSEVHLCSLVCLICMGILGLVLFQVYSAWAFWASFSFRFILHGHSGPRSVSGLFCMGILGLVLFQIESLVEHFQDWVRHLLSAHDYVVVLGFFF